MKYAIIVWARASKTGPHDFVLSVGETESQALERYREKLELPDTCRPFERHTRIELVEVYGPTKTELTLHRRK